MPSGGWGCPHEVDDLCSKVANRQCDPGMKGCELYSRYVFFDPGKNARLEQKHKQALARPVTIPPGKEHAPGTPTSPEKKTCD